MTTGYNRHDDHGRRPPVRIKRADFGDYAGGKKYLEIIGNLLIYHQRKNGLTTSFYYPLASVQFYGNRRRDGRTIIRGLLTFLLSLLLGLALGALLQILLKRLGISETTANDIAMYSGLACIVAGFLYACFSTVRFFFPKETGVIFVPEYEIEGKIEFWNSKRESSEELRRIIEIMDKFPEVESPDTIAPMSITHNWTYLYPIKNALTTTGIIFFVVYFAMSRLEDFLKDHEDLEALALTIFFAAPILAGLATYLWCLSIYRRKGPDYRIAFESFDRGDYLEAQTRLIRLFQENNEDMDVVRLLTHTYVQIGDFDKALKCATHLDFSHVENEKRFLGPIRQIQLWQTKAA